MPLTRGALSGEEESIMDKKKEESHLLVKVALIFSIVNDAVIIVIEILKLLLKK